MDPLRQPTLNPPSVEKQIGRTCWIAYLNGGSIAGFALFCMFLSLLLGPDWLGVCVCLCLTASGIMEVQGGRLLRAGHPNSRRLLKGSQLVCFFTLAGYCIYQIRYHDIVASLNAVSPEFLDLLAELYQLPRDALITFFTKVLKFAYAIVVLVSCCYQGGLWLYYDLKCKKIFAHADQSQMAQG